MQAVPLFRIHWLNRILNYLLGPRFKSDHFDEQTSSIVEESLVNHTPSDNGMNYSDIGADLGSEFLENPGTLFWMIDSAYRRIEKICCDVTQAVAARHAKSASSKYNL